MSARDIPADELVAFVDEPRKPVRDEATGRVAGEGGHYVVAAAVVLRGDADDCRLALRDLAERENAGEALRPNQGASEPRCRRLGMWTRVSFMIGAPLFVIVYSSPLATRRRRRPH